MNKGMAAIYQRMKQASLSEEPAPIVPPAPTRVVGLVACCGRKLAAPAAARDLYQSPLFKKSLALAERTCDVVYVLSAKHGLLELDQVVEPYQMRLGVGRGASWEAQAWGHRTAAQLRAKFDGARLVYFAGNLYRRSLEAGLMALHFQGSSEAPLAGMGIGESLRYLSGVA